ncbi:MAG TPA: hypothetical protein VG672_24795 [Bryobacteraceae bacterium]|jgi:trehalose/maltose hydrolase-like predicted phosphorylase|nr:hypothetical protein [Bryobacteraceae bacterium]
MKYLQAMFTLVLSCAVLSAQDSTFLLTAEALSPYTRTYLGNGLFSLVSSQWGTRPAESFMAKLYDHAPDDVARIAALPAWNEVNVFNGQSWLNDTPLESGALRSWRQTLNMYDGYLLTSYDWTDGSRTTSVEVQAFVSRANPHLAAVRLRIVPQYSGSIKVALPIRAWNEPKRLPVARLEKLERDAGGKLPDVRYAGYMVAKDTHIEHGPEGAVLRMVSQADGGSTSVAEVAAVEWPQGLRRLTSSGSVARNLVTVEADFQAEAGKSYTFYKYVAAVPSFDSPATLETASRVARASRARGYQAIFDEHARAWHDIWKTDILVDGNPELQKVIHSTTFYLLGSIREGTEFNIPPMGLSSSGYVGHIFWDSDTFMYPALLLLHPEMAKSAALFRCNTLEAARANARLNGYKGAMYPWEADETGRESTPYFAWQNALRENHVTSDVALAQWQYYLATGDKDFLTRCAYPVLKETADYWVSRSTYNQAQDRYEIRKVVSPDEGSRGVDNDVVTNIGARKTMELALTASRLVGKPENPDWRKVMDKLYIVYNRDGQYYPEYEGAPAWRSHVGHVTPLLNYPFEYPTTAQARRNTLENALKSIASTGGGAYLLPTIYPVVAAEIGDQALIDACFRRSYQPYLKPPFHVLNEGTRGESINFLTGTGFLQQFVFGYTGLRLSEEGVTRKFTPVLPSGIRRLTIRNATIRGKKYDLLVEGNTLRQTEVR